jgi:alkylhydroperoxidase family enzyme
MDEGTIRAQKTAGAQADRVRLVKPSEARDEVAAVYADIRATKGAKFLTPTWGFFANDPELLKLWWALQKRVQKVAGEVPKKTMLGIMFVCASEIGCPRCINNAQVHLQEQLGLSDEDILALADFEHAASISAQEKAVYRFCRKLAFDLPTTEEDFGALRAAGYSDRAIVEMVSLTILESGFIRRARALAPFEDGAQWPKENLPSSVYAQNVDSKRG